MVVVEFVNDGHNLLGCGWCSKERFNGRCQLECVEVARRITVVGLEDFLDSDDVDGRAGERGNVGVGVGVDVGVNVGVEGVWGTGYVATSTGQTFRVGARSEEIPRPQWKSE